MSKKIFQQFAAKATFVGVVMMAGVLSQNTAQASASGEAWVSNVSGQVVSVINSGASNASKSSKFRSLFSRNADTNSIGLYVLGKYRKKLPAARRSEYFSLVKRYVAKVYLSHLNKARVKNVDIKSSKPCRKDECVKTVVSLDGKSPLKITWRIRPRGGSYRIVDLNVQGIWLAGAQQSSFVSRISSSGGDVNALINWLKTQ